MSDLMIYNHRSLRRLYNLSFHDMSERDPNFPVNLSIKPLDTEGESGDSREQGRNISQYGIAGRVWYVDR
jgi:hypothetical protein